MDMSTYKKAHAMAIELIDRLNSGRLGWDRVAAVAVLKKNGETFFSSNQACHAGLNVNGWGENGPGGVAVASGLMQPKEKEALWEDEALKYLDWLLNRSPYACTFVSKTPEQALFDKFIISSGHHPSNLMAAGLVASRRLWEYPVIARVFCDLVDAGVKEDLAYYLAHIASCAFKQEGIIRWNGSNRGHCSFDTERFDWHVLHNWLNNKPTKLNQNYVDNSNYNGYDAMFGERQSEAVGSWIHKNFPYKGKSKGAANPFAKALVADRSCDYWDGIKIMAEFQHKIIEKMNEEVGA